MERGVEYIDTHQLSTQASLSGQGISLIKGDFSKQSSFL
jgi:hypothetical protein